MFNSWKRRTKVVLAATSAASLLAIGVGLGASLNATGDVRSVKSGQLGALGWYSNTYSRLAQISGMVFDGTSLWAGGYGYLAKIDVNTGLPLAS